MAEEHNVKAQKSTYLLIWGKTKYLMKSEYRAKDEKLINVKSCLATTRSYTSIQKKEVVIQDPDKETKADCP